MLEQMDPEDSADLRTLLADENRPEYSAIVRVLKRRGHSISESALSRHTRGICMCGDL